LTATVAVTGGSGYIGSHVIDALIDAGCTVRVLDQRAPHRADAEWVPCDVLDLEGLTHAVAGADLVYHLAAVADVNDVIADPTVAVEVNTLGTARVLEAARRADAGRVVLASTVWVYAATSPAPGADGDQVDEDSPFDPATDRHLYVTSKVAAEMACRDYLTLYGRPFTVLRYGIPYGPRMRDNCVVAAFMQRAMRGETLRIDGDGSQHRFFVYVEDLARAHVRALDDVAVNRTYNLEGAVPVSIREIAESVIDLVGTGAVEFGPARPGDLRARTVSNERARAELGWTPTTSFADGLARTHAWYLARAAELAAEADKAQAAELAGKALGNLAGLADLADAEDVVLDHLTDTPAPTALAGAGPLADTIAPDATPAGTTALDSVLDEAASRAGALGGMTDDAAGALGGMTDEAIGAGPADLARTTDEAAEGARALEGARVLVGITDEAVNAVGAGPADTIGGAGTADLARTADLAGAAAGGVGNGRLAAVGEAGDATAAGDDRGASA
jgi:UDP-glucose 4-epimerase